MEWISQLISQSLLSDLAVVLGVGGDHVLAGRALDPRVVVEGHHAAPLAVRQHGAVGLAGVAAAVGGGRVVRRGRVLDHDAGLSPAVLAPAR